MLLMRSFFCGIIYKNGKSIIDSQLTKEGLESRKYDVHVYAYDYSEIPFSVQYNETHYNYLARMAEDYREQFYYGG